MFATEVCSNAKFVAPSGFFTLIMLPDDDDGDDDLCAWGLQTVALLVIVVWEK